MMAITNKMIPKEHEVEIEATPDFLSEHKKWLLQLLYEDRKVSGDVEFVFKNEQEDELEGGVPTSIKCHSQVLEANSGFFKGMFEFQKTAKQETQAVRKIEVVLTSPRNIMTMVEFFYLGKTSTNSKNLVEMLELC